MEGSVRAAKEMVAKGYRVLICTSPVLTSAHCAGEKFEWVREHLGPEWVRQIVLTSDKTSVRGDVLIDDKPKIVGAYHPVWQQLMFDAPYNLKCLPRARIAQWDAAGIITAVDALMISGPPPGGATPPPLQAGASPSDEPDDHLSTFKHAVAAMPDFSHLLPPDYRSDYAAWRSGREKGARGELREAMTRMELMQHSVLNNTSDEFTEVTAFRSGYASWRKGNVGGAKSKSFSVSQL